MSHSVSCVCVCVYLCVYFILFRISVHKFLHCYLRLLVSACKRFAVSIAVTTPPPGFLLGFFGKGANAGFYLEWWGIHTSVFFRAGSGCPPPEISCDQTVHFRPYEAS